MAEVKRFVVLGLGMFGRSLAIRLSENGCRVTGVDRSEKNVEALDDRLYEAIVADVADLGTLRQLMLDHAEVVFIALQEHNSLLVAMHAKELGAAQIVARGFSEDHARMLERLGVDRVVFPEREIAVQMADHFTWPSVLEPLRIDPESNLLEVPVPKTLVGKKVDLRRQYDVYVLAIREALQGKVDVSLLSDEQLLVLVGTQEKLDQYHQAENNRRSESPPGS